jgi:CMP-N-acetylneuraminic acid synthetase
MTKNFRHIAVIPAREGSIGFPKKNQVFFDNTANFLDQVSWIDEILVNSNDTIVLDKARSRNYTIYDRPESLSGPEISIKSVFTDLINSKNLKNNEIIWLFYLPILFKNIQDFEKAKTIIEEAKIKSLCTFIPVKSHPFNAWKYDEENKKIYQYIKNDFYRRQDLPPAWIHYHYVCCFKVSEIDKLNNELLNMETYPVFLSKEYAKNLIEIDTPEDLEKWKQANNKI